MELNLYSPTGLLPHGVVLNYQRHIHLSLASWCRLRILFLDCLTTNEHCMRIDVVLYHSQCVAYAFYT